MLIGVIRRSKATVREKILHVQFLWQLTPGESITMVEIGRCSSVQVSKVCNDISLGSPGRRELKRRSWRAPRPQAQAQSFGFGISENSNVTIETGKTDVNPLSSYL